MSTTSGSSNTKDVFDAAKAIVAALDGMTKEHQTLAIKFAVETLGLQSPTAAVSPPTSSASAAATTATTPSGGVAHSTDIKAFTVTKAPKSDQQFTAVVAYFYQFEAKPNERRDTIDAEVMKEAARLAGRPQVQRWSMTLTNAKNAGYLDSAGDGKYKLSSVGENLVAITLPDNGGAPAKSRQKSKAKTPQRKAKKTTKKVK
ncbi:MAG: hypothetical protein IPM18_02130 [Phycisphaerales bacterium]|nr:hypothetical protein [Phycisphaerales bacterium]